MVSGSLRVALVGAGGVGERHAATLAALDDVHLVAVTDVDAARAQALADEHDARTYPTQADLLDSETVDAIWLCVPPFAHGEPEQLAIDAGVPFFVEKPLGLDLGTPQNIARAVEASGLPTATGYHWRCMPGVERAREVLAGSPVRLATGTWFDKVPPVAWWTSRSGSGGQLNEQATHLVDVMRNWWANRYTYSLPARGWPSVTPSSSIRRRPRYFPSTPAPSPPWPRPARWRGRSRRHSP
jgi:predicted dehydrogenase